MKRSAPFEVAGVASTVAQLKRFFSGGRGRERFASATHERILHWKANRFSSIARSSKWMPLLNMDVAASGTVKTRNLPEPMPRLVACFDRWYCRYNS